MSYKISVPVINGTVKRNGREKITEDLRILNAERIFLSLDCYEVNEEKKRESLSELKENCEYFHSQGFEVGAWVWAFMFKEKINYNRITMVDSQLFEEEKLACPLDAEFLEFSGEYIKDIASTGVDMIMFDDDLRLGFYSHGQMGCLCSKHVDMICDRLGEHLSRDELAERILFGGKNKYRDAWLECNGESIENFARNARRYVDKVNPKIRMGQCACLSSWDVDGTSAKRVSRILAGDTRPFVRLIGAPYWAARGSWGNRLQNVIELERMESVWTRDGDIEIFAEGDTYPRPRTQTPASYLEGFDTAIRASGCTDGILKYAIDYTSSAAYERGYINFHERNKKLYEEIDNIFGDKNACGVRIYEFQNKVANADLSAYADRQKAAQYLFFSYAARFLSCQSIPSVYEGKGICGIAFGENAKYLDRDQIKGGLIIDASAAKMLYDRGIDVGIRRIGEKINAVTEQFVCDGEIINAFNAQVYNNDFNENIRVLSRGSNMGAFSLMGDCGRNISIPMSYLYENSDGERFLVLNVEAGNVVFDNTMKLLEQQARGRQIADNIEWLSGGKRLTAYSYGNPFLYMIAKEKGDKLSIGLWNFFADPVFEPLVELGEDYSSIRCINGSEGVVEGSTVRLSQIPAFGFAAFELTK